MRNRDMPAKPVVEERWVDPTNVKLGTIDYDGLTKLEYAAIKILPHIISAGLAASYSHKEAAIHASAYAHALFDQLEQENSSE